MDAGNKFTPKKECCTSRLISKEMLEIKREDYSKFKSVNFLYERRIPHKEGGLRLSGYFKNNIKNKPLVTIITAVFNGGKNLEKTILSIVNQTYDNIEYIIIDGGSSDNTLAIIKKYDKVINYWISESDLGISDAFNKGVRVSSGAYINFQGDGDGFISSDALEKVFTDINPAEDMLVSTRIQRIDINGKELFSSKYIESFDKKSLLFKMSLPHQGLFTHKNYFEQYGLFDVNNVFCMDYDHLLRSYHKFPKVVTKDIVTARWRDDGLGKGKTLEILDEYNKIKRNNKIANSLVLNFVHYWSVFKYHVKQLMEKIKHDRGIKI